MVVETAVCYGMVGFVGGSTLDSFSELFENKYNDCVSSILCSPVIREISVEVIQDNMSTIKVPVIVNTALKFEGFGAIMREVCFAPKLGHATVWMTSTRLTSYVFFQRMLQAFANRQCLDLGSTCFHVS